MPDIEIQSYQLFMEVVEKPLSEWPAFLDLHCQSPELRAKVQALLDLHVRSSDFLFKSAAATYPHLISPFGDRVEEFKIIRQLGRGGMGAVYLAEDTILKRPVALKIVVHAKEDGAVTDRFKREARAAARLINPGIVQVYRNGEGAGFSFIAMEYVDGVTFSDHLISQKPARRQNDSKWFVKIAQFISQVADALDFAHRHSVIHRDVKPSNILIDGSGVARLTDFGIARITTEKTLLDAGSIVGSLPYMSPEQAKVCNNEIDHRTDIFSLGVVLYEAVSTKRPFEGSTHKDVLKALAIGRPVQLRKAWPSVPVDLAIICHKAMESELAHRYQTAAHMSADLRCFIEGRPILARPPSFDRRARYWIRNHQYSLLIALAVVLSIGLVAISAAYTLAQRAMLGRLEITDAHTGSAVTATSYTDDLTPENQVSLGTAPMSAYLKPGLYRITIANGKETLEASSLIEAGAVDAIEVNSPTHDFSQSLIRIPGGSFSVGKPHSVYPLSKQRVIDQPGFFISSTEVSNRQYNEYVIATKARPPATWSVPYHPAIDDLPVTGVSWDEANRYCRWKGVRLPTPTEWEIACRGPEGSVFPWSPSSIPNIQRHESQEMNREEYLRWARPVGSDRHLATPLGVMHMLSNVQEYTEGIAFDRNRGIIVKGRSWADIISRHPADISVLSGRSLRGYDLGFRVVLSEGKEK